MVEFNQELTEAIAIMSQSAETTPATENTEAKGEEVVPPFLSGDSGSAEEVRAAAGLSERLSTAQPCLNSRLEVSPLLLLAAEQMERFPADTYQRVGATER